jgi:uncharacterized protein
MKKFLPIAFLALAVPLAAFAYTSPGKPTGFVNDFASVFTVEQKASLEQVLTENEKATGNEISIIVVSSLDGDTIENYAEKLFQEWGIGKKEADNGALLLVALEDRKMRIEVGYGLEPTLTDAISSRIIRNTITPQFKEGKYYEGIAGGVEQMIAATKGEALAPIPESTFPWPDSLEAYVFLIWVGFALLQWILSMLARSRSWWMGGALGGAAGVIAIIFATLTAGLIVAAIFIPLGLLLDYFVSREYAKSSASGRTPHWWAGGPWIGGGFGGGGGLGGFGGFGGGRSGGGGSSGNW